MGTALYPRHPGLIVLKRDLSIKTTTTKLGKQESLIDILISAIADRLLGAKRDSRTE